MCTWMGDINFVPYRQRGLCPPSMYTSMACFVGMMNSWQGAVTKVQFFIVTWLFIGIHPAKRTLHPQKVTLVCGQILFEIFQLLIKLFKLRL